MRSVRLVQLVRTRCTVGEVLRETQENIDLHCCPDRTNNRTDTGAQRGRAVPAPALYHDIADELREQVAKLHPGDRLPAEAELRRTHGASRFTIRSALQELEREGLIFSAQGRGWFVRDQRPVIWHASAPETNVRTDISPADAWSIGIRDQHREPKEEITVETVVGPEWIRDLLALGRGEHMVIRRRRRYVDGMFSHTDDTAFPEPIVRGTPI